MARFYNSKLELSVFILGFLTLNRFATSEAYPAMKSAENYTEKCIPNQVNNKFVYSKEEDPNQIYYTVVREQLEAYALHSALSSSERSSIDTTLQLLLDKLLFKYNFLRKYLTNDNEMSTSLLEDFFTDFSGIRHASNFLTYNKYGNRHFEFDDLCAVYNELFMYNLGFIEYLIEKHYLIKTLKCDQNMTKICKNFQEDFTLHLKRHQAFDKAYMSIDKLIMIYKGRPLCPFSANYLDIAAIMGFKLSILKFDLNEENLIENYNNLILGYIRDYFPKKNLDDLKQYTNFLITDNNIIRVIDKICVYYGCDSEKLVHLALFIDKFPLVNSTVKAYIHYLNLFNKETFKEHSYDLLVLERAIEIKMEEPVFSLIDVNLREQFMKAYESLRSETKIIKHTIVKNAISKSRDVDVGLHTVLNKHSNFFPYEWIMLGAENIVQSFYDINPNEVSTILSLIQYFKLPEKRYAGYKQLLDIFIPGNNDMEMLRTAYYIKREKNEEYFASLKNFLPALIRRLIWNNGVNFCFLENNAYHQYLFTESTYTAYGKDWTEFAYGKVEEYPRLAPLTLLDYQAYLFPWIFEYEKSSNSILIKNFKGLYLSSREHDNGDGKFPLHFLLSEEEEGGNIIATKWKFRLVNQSSNTESSSLFLLHDSNYPPRYLYAQNDTKNKFPNTREVFLSQLMTETDDFFWTLTCKDDTSEEDLPGKAEEEKSYEYITPIGTTDRCNDSKKVLPDLMNFRDETNIFISFLERLDMKRFSPFVKHSSTEDTPHFMELSKELDNFMKKTSVYLQVQFTELIGFSRYNLLLQRISYLHLSDIDIDVDDNGEVDDEVQNNEAEEKETEDEKGDEMPTEQWKRTRRQYEQLEKTQNYRKINRYNNLLIREIERIMMVTLMHTDLFQNNSKLQKNNPPCARETFDICSKLSGYISKYVDYTLILNKIAEKTIEIHSKSQISKFLQALVYAKKSWVTLSANNVKKCLIKNGINTIQKFIEWKGQSTSGIDYYLHSNVIEIQRFKLLAKLIAETLAAMKFHLSEIYFMILKDSYKDYYVSQNPILKNTYSLYNISDYLIDGSCTACDENIHHYFAFFVSHLYKKNRFDADTASEVLNYTYRKLENSSQLTEPLRDTYSHKARQILQTLNDTEGHSLPIKSVNTSTDKTDTVKFKLNKLIIDENTRVMDFAKIITGKKLNEAKLARIRHRFYYFYRFSNVVKLTSFMYQLGGEESKCFKRIYEFIEYMKFYYQGSLQTDPLCWRCPPRNRPKDRVLLDTYDVIVSNLLLNNSQNDNRYAIELADYTYNKFGYIPCFHSGCVNDVETILPGYTRLYFEDKVCSLRSVPSGKYLSVSLNNHAVIYETHNFKPLRTSIKVKTKGGTVKSQNKEVSPIIDSYYNWAFEYVENNGRFLIKSQNKQLYLSLENQKANSSDYYNLVLGNKYEKHPIEWTIDLQKNEVFSNQVFYIRPSGDLNNTSLYLSYNKTQQANLVLKLKSNNFKEDIDGLAFVWFVDCH